MTAADYQSLAADAADATARVEAATARIAFDPNAPLPDLHIQKRSWEPAARHYRDLTETEKSEQACSPTSPPPSQ